MSTSPQEYSTLRIPKSSLGYHSNNVYQKFPPMMSDGRSLVSNWQPESYANHKIIMDNKLTTNWSYRKYLTDNANEIMKTNFIETSNDTGYITPSSEVFRYNAKSDLYANYLDKVEKTT